MAVLNATNSGTRTLEKIVSGGQTGVDRAALDAALELGLPCGGWCPRDRLAEDGPIPDRYPLEETDGADYAERTRLNVRDSDATLVLVRGRPGGGTALTIAIAGELGRPCKIVDLAAGEDEVDEVRAWIGSEHIAVLNLAGPRESTAPGIHRRAAAFLKALLSGR